MLRNYLKIAFRNILKNKSHAFINILGLTIGIAACLLLFLWVQDELSYDRFHKNADRIYRVAFQNENEGEVSRATNTSAALAPTLVREFPWIEKAVRFAKREYLIKCNNKTFREEVFLSDPEFLQVFSLPFILGNSNFALKEQYSIIISETIWEKYFGRENPLGKVISINGNKDYTITGVFKNLPQNSHFKFNFMCDLQISPKNMENWGVMNNYTYILVKPHTVNPEQLIKERITAIIDKYRGRELREKYKMTYFLQPLTSIHLHSDLRNEIEPNRDITTVYIFFLIALFILVIACLNYINLATARFANRSKEIGLRKVLGATPRQLVVQFLGESFLLTLVSLPLAALLAELLLPTFNSVAGKMLSFHYFTNLYLWLGFLGILVVVGFGSGLVPAFFLSRFNPTTVMAKVSQKGRFLPILRKVLVVFQFSISIAFIICSIFMASQLYFMRTTRIGLNKENVVVVHFNYNEQARSKYETIKSEFSKIAEVKSVCASDFFPGKIEWDNNYWHDGVSSNEYLSIFCTPVDTEFFQTFEIKVVEGRGFSRDFPADENSAFVLNQAALRSFGWQSAVGKNFNVSNWKKGRVVGVVEDINFDSLHQEVSPMVYYIDPSAFEYIAVRISPRNIPQTLSSLKQRWEELVPGQVFTYSFLDDDFASLYQTEAKLAKIFMVATILSIFIACLGLFGLASFTSEQRTKEIAIRKILGATVSSVMLLLSCDFVRWVLLGNIIAWPVAWYAMKQWLQNFAYRISLSPWIFFAAGLVVLIISLLTVGYKAYKAAVLNPADALKYE